MATSALSKVKKGGRAEQISLSLLRHAFPSLHFNGVATDAFGNALGNSFVANRIDAEQTRLNAMRASEAVSQQANKAVNAKLDAQLAASGREAMENVTSQSQEQTERIMQALAYNRALDLNEVEAAKSVKRQTQ